jgi:hypothetical protein
VADVHVYVNRPAGKEGTALEDLIEALEKLDHVSDVDVNSPGNVVAVSFEGGQAEREAIERRGGSRLRGLEDFCQDHLRRGMRPVGYGRAGVNCPLFITGVRSG